jgi:hypothetical protein
MSTDVAKRTPPDKKQLAAAYAAILDGEKLPTIGDPEVMSRMILERILKAETFDEAFKPQTLDSWRDYLDVPVTVQEFHLNPSGYEQGSSVYAVVDLKRLDDGAGLTVTCGGRNVLAQLVKMLEQSWTDKPVKLTAKTTGEGYQALWLVAA